MKPIDYMLHRDILMEGFDGKTCRIDGTAFRTSDTDMHIAFRHLLLTGSDVFTGSFVISSNDGGNTFGEPKPFSPVPDTFENGVRTTHTLGAYYHEASDSMYCIGHATRYADEKHPILFGRDIMPPLSGTFDRENLCFASCERLALPALEEYDMIIFMEPLDEPDGSVLIPAYIRKGDSPKHQVVVVRFDVMDGKLVYREHGDIVRRDDLNRGLCEPRIARLGGKYYMTIRSDEIGFFACSDDGLNYSVPTEWVWDDGEILTSRNTQQAWLSHPDGLFLVYTRETPHNKHIFRRRAPLFMARFDEDRHCLVKDTEVIAVPEMGARLGNFTVRQMKENEAWICVSEWMQTTEPDPTDWRVCVRYGARNRLWRTRVVW